MMNNPAIFPLLALSAPVISALVCAVMLLSFRNMAKEPNMRYLHKTLLAFYAVIAFNWTYGLMYIYNLDILANLNAVVYCTYFLVQVVLYQYTYTITRLPEEKSFSWKHYITPAIAFVVTLVWDFFVPQTDKLYATLYVDGSASDYPAYHTWINARYWIRAVFSLVYTVLAVWRIMRYRREIVNFSADIERSLSGWLMLCILLAFPMIIIPLGVSVVDPRSLLGSVFWIIPSLLIITQMVVLCYFTITNYYVIIEDIPESTIEKPTTSKQQDIILNKKNFEKYIMTEKPYLNPRVKITDLCIYFSTNRTYMSSFINRRYGMNFRQYMNSLRLKEVEHLQIGNSYSDEDREELSFRAGFGSYRSYLRVKAEMEG
jgi:hypothetical protein